MPSLRERATEGRADRPRKVLKLVQAWVSPALQRALDARAKSEGRKRANFVRRELGKIVGIVE